MPSFGPLSSFPISASGGGSGDHYLSAVEESLSLSISDARDIHYALYEYVTTSPVNNNDVIVFHTNSFSTNSSNDVHIESSSPINITFYSALSNDVLFIPPTEFITTSPVLGNDFSTGFNSSFSVSNYSFTNDHVSSCNSTISINETYTDFSEWVNESGSLLFVQSSSSPINSIYREFGESIFVSSSSDWGYEVNLSNQLAFSSGYDVGYIINSSSFTYLTDSLLVDQLSGHTTSLNMVSVNSKNIDTPIGELISILFYENNINTFNVSDSVVINISSSSDKIIVPTELVNLVISEDLYRESVWYGYCEDGILISDSCNNVYTINRQYLESLSLSPLESIEVSSDKYRNVSISSSRTRLVTSNNFDVISMNTSHTDLANWLNDSYDPISFSASRPRFTTSNRKDTLNVVSVKSVIFTPNSIQSLMISDSISNTYAISRVFNESLSLSVNSGKDVNKPVFTSFGVFDTVLRNCNSVVSDIVVSEIPKTIAEFRTMADKYSPLGYDTFRNLIPGDYTYTKAIIGIRVESSSTGIKVGVSNAKVIADVNDVLDRGTKVLNAELTTVTFNRVFTTPPEVTITSRTASGPCIPRIDSITTTGFTMALYDASNPATMVAGTVSWTAIGY